MSKQYKDYDRLVFVIGGKENLVRGDWLARVDGRLAIEWADVVYGIEEDGSRTILKSKHGYVP
jgi:hypothetical protein